MEISNFTNLIKTMKKLEALSFHLPIDQDWNSSLDEWSHNGNRRYLQVEELIIQNAVIKEKFIYWLKEENPLMIHCNRQVKIKLLAADGPTANANKPGMESLLHIFSV